MSRVSIWLIGVLVLLSGNSPAECGDARGDSTTKTFAEEMIRGVGATRLECSAQIIEQVRAQEMDVLCARFDGSFQRFELRWNVEILQRGMVAPPSGIEPVPLAQPATEWESRGSFYERIYRVGSSALGVRFAAGDVLMVW